LSNATVRRAVILAAGRGKRMGTFTEEVPKPMLKVNGKPMLEHIIDRLSQAGIKKFLVVVGYHGDVIQQHFLNSPYNIKFKMQEPVNGTATATLLAEDFIKKKPWILTYGDILCDPAEYTRCISVVERHPATAAVVAVKQVDDPWQGAAVYEIAGVINKIVEKPPQGTSTTRWNSAGFYLFQRVVFNYLHQVVPSSRGEFELTSALDLMLADRLELRISAIAGDWRDVGRPEDLAAVNSR
jgi:UDP-N-acetylglucosamine diphosphorylase / glucose-1-phosphate thymidylyltransferase / UDP-N-acetylgalactosamine diphosphorylase / glucosamine-1-phosphate N-acetyltransferase / galactosamine-1-phosphate N-acetyltransferase